MADDSMALLDTLRKATEAGDVDVLREGVRILAQAVMEAEVSERIWPSSRRRRAVRCRVVPGGRMMGA